MQHYPAAPLKNRLKQRQLTALGQIIRPPKVPLQLGRLSLRTITQTISTAFGVR